MYPFARANLSLVAVAAVGWDDVKKRMSAQESVAVAHQQAIKVSRMR